MIFIDDLGKKVQLHAYPPKRIISVVPSLTELLYDLGLEDQIVGITKFCIFPEVLFRNKPRIGGTKTLNLEKIKSLQPDLIIANKEENQQSDINELSAEFPTYVTDIKLLTHAIEKIKTIGDLTMQQKRAGILIDDINRGFSQINIASNKPKVAYMIWKDPIMVAGGDTYIHDMLVKAGFENVFEKHSRYPSVKIEDIKNSEVDFIFLSSEPFPFKEKDIAYFEGLIPDTNAILVDGTMFSWYGSRLKLAPPYFINLQKELKK